MTGPMSDQIMKAAVYECYGPAEILRIRTVDRPKRADGRVLVRVRATSVNPVDFKVRRGDLKTISGRRFPRLSGGDFAGEVAAVGRGVEGFSVGDRVFGMISALKGGAAAEYLSVPVKALAGIPEGVGFEQAASLPIAGLTALQSLRDLGKLKPGGSALILGATGGVGHFAVQIAKNIGARVTAVCSGANAGLAGELGADEVVDYRSENILERKERFDVFLDAAARTSFLAVRHLINPGGVYVATLPSAARYLQMVFAPFLGGRRSRVIFVRTSRSDLSELGEGIAAGRLHPLISKTYPLEKIVEAHEQLETEHTRGKVVVRIGEPAGI